MNIYVCIHLCVCMCAYIGIFKCKAFLVKLFFELKQSYFHQSTDGCITYFLCVCIYMAQLSLASVRICLGSVSANQLQSGSCVNVYYEFNEIKLQRFSLKHIFNTLHSNVSCCGTHLNTNTFLWTTSLLKCQNYTLPDILISPVPIPQLKDLSLSLISYFLCIKSWPCLY